MEKNYEKNHKITSYNINYGKYIVASADYYPAMLTTGFILEVTPYDDEILKASLELTAENSWKDLVDSKEYDSEPSGRTETMLSSMLKNFESIRPVLSIVRRKDVYDLALEKNGLSISLALVYEYERFPAGSENFHPAVFVHDMEEFDTWQFAVDETEEKIITDVYASVKSRRIKNLN